MNVELSRLWHDAERAFAGGQAAAARAAYESLVAREPRHVGAWLRLSALATGSGRYRDSVAAALHAAAAVAGAPALRLPVASRLLDVGESQPARGLFDALLAGAIDPPLAADAAFVAHRLEDHAAAATLAATALRAQPRDPALLALLGTALTFCGRLDEAERALDDCLRVAPDLGSAHWTLSKLRRWSAEHNHVGRLQRLAATLDDGDPSAPYVHYALFKELEDCGRDVDAWTALERGCAARRRHVRYDADAERRLFAQLAARCDAGFLARQAPPGDGPVQ